MKSFSTRILAWNRQISCRRSGSSSWPFCSGNVQNGISASGYMTTSTGPAARLADVFAGNSRNTACAQYAVGNGGWRQAKHGVPLRLLMTMSGRASLPKGIRFREAQRLMPHRVRGLLTVPTIDLVLEDTIHLDEESQFILGRRMAEAMSTLLHEPNSLPPPIELDRAVLRYDRAHGLHELHVHYRNVAGSLRSAGRPNGFAIGEEACHLAYRVILDGSQVILKCAQNIPSFSYGYGLNPYCNITDGAGRSLPACAMQPVAYPFTRGDYANHVQLSEPIYGCELAEITAEQAHGLSFAPAQNNPPFSIFPDRLEHLTEDGVRFFRARYYAEDELDLSLALGYDGNVKVFVDGRSVYLDEQARNPIIPASHLIQQHWSQGEHEVLIAQAMNHGCTWGISLAPEKPTATDVHLPQEKTNDI